MVKHFCLVSEKGWHDDLFEKLSTRKNEKWVRIRKKEDFIIENLRKENFNTIFIPHWSFKIPSDIWENFKCIVFHMTDLPFGRGGSPLQNLIIRGYQNTMISALKVTDGIDEGPIYLKAPLSLHGTAREIFVRSAGVIEGMIEKIIETQPEPIKQVGKEVIFKRRKKEDGNIANLENLEEVYNYIRMLDCEGYPNAFLETESLRLEFSGASMEPDNLSLTTHVRIIKK